MKYFALVAAVLLYSLTVTGARAADNPGGKVYEMNALNGSRQHGTIALKPRGAHTVVEIHLLNAPASMEPAHIHTGTCGHLNTAPQYPLTSLVDGISETTIDQPIAALTAGGLSVNVHQSMSALKVYVACGELSGAGHH
jgi:hypothetical protein